MNFGKKILIAAATMAAAFCLFAASAFAMDVYQTNNNVNLRTGPGTGYPVITVVPVGSDVYCEQRDDVSGWWQVDYGDYLGWMSSAYIGPYGANNAAPAATTSSFRDCTVISDVNLRSGPSTNYSSYIVLPAGSSISVDSVSGGWAHSYYGNYEGYVAAKYVSGLTGSEYASANNAAQAASNSQYATTVYNGHDYANVYDYAYYCAHNQDVVQALGKNPQAILQHFVTYGMSEGRQAISSFNVYTYRDAHPELNAIYGTDLPSYYLHACGIV